MQNLIKIGDEMKNLDGELFHVTAMDTGKHGIRAFFDYDKPDCQAYFPWELPPIKDAKPNWYGWADYDTLILANGMEVGVLAMSPLDAHANIEDYDSRWQDTVTSIRKEQEEEQRLSIIFGLEDD